MGKMPLTLFVITAATVLWLYLRRAQVGSIKHPGEKVRPPAPRGGVVNLKPARGAPPVLPWVGGFRPPVEGGG